MRYKKQTVSHFSRAIASESLCLRPDNEAPIKSYPADSLPRGAGLSYSDCCFNTDGYIIDTQRLNHFIEFDAESGLVECQAGVPLKDLFLLNPDFIPPVLPGTVHATIGGAIANDVHGKNNHLEGGFGKHVAWIELQLNGQTIRCSKNEKSDLFHATIGGLGLTGIITRAGILLKKVAPFVQVERRKFQSLNELIKIMSTEGLNHDYQVAWLDLINTPKTAILSLANHCQPVPLKRSRAFNVPKIPLSLVQPWSMKLFNRFYFNQKVPQQILSLEEFNNPLDKINNWNRLYGPKGLIQFQAILPQDKVNDSLDHLLELMKNNKATPMLAVLKLFIQSGNGLLSFCKPGFTLAIDFMNNIQAEQAIKAMNAYICELGGQIYLAKDLLLTPEQFHSLYPKVADFKEILSQYQCSTHSDLAKRIGILQ